MIKKTWLFDPFFDLGDNDISYEDIIEEDYEVENQVEYEPQVKKTLGAFVDDMYQDHASSYESNNDDIIFDSDF